MAHIYGADFSTQSMPSGEFLNKPSVGVAATAAQLVIQVANDQTLVSG
jgi:hypothetical protein